MADIQQDYSGPEEQSPDESTKRKSFLQKLADRDYPAIHKDIDEAIDTHVVEPLAAAGHPDAAAVAGTAASTAKDYFVPHNDAELAAAVIPVRGLGAAGKALNLEGKAAKVGEQIAEKFPRIRQLMEGGMPEAKIAEMAQNVRTAGSHQAVDEGGKLVATVGEHSPLGQELKGYGREATNAANEAAPTARYFDRNTVEMHNVEMPNKTPLDRGPKGEALDYYNRTGIDPRNKNALQTLDQLRKKLNPNRDSE